MKPCAVIFAPPALLPDFAVWQAQREKCVACRHCLVYEMPHRQASATTLRCLAITHVGPVTHPYCIDAREAECGPDAKLFEASHV